jgi:hypothetical protein
MDYSDADTALILKYAGVDWEPGRHDLCRCPVIENYKCIICKAAIPLVDRGDGWHKTPDIPAPPLDSNVFEKCLVELQRRGYWWRLNGMSSGPDVACLINPDDPTDTELVHVAADSPRDAVFAAVLALQKEQPK